MPRCVQPNIHSERVAEAILRIKAKQGIQNFDFRSASPVSTVAGRENPGSPPSGIPQTDGGGPGVLFYDITKKFVGCLSATFTLLAMLLTLTVGSRAVREFLDTTFNTFPG